jgi:septal ring factor EnvC (AmiA/AmiB activator)
LFVEVETLTFNKEATKLELESYLSEVRTLKDEKERLGKITDKSKQVSLELSSLEAAEAEARESLNRKTKELALLKAIIASLTEDVEQLTKNSAYLETSVSVGAAINERLLRLQEKLSAKEEELRASTGEVVRTTATLELVSKEIADLRKEKSTIEDTIFERRRELATLEGIIELKRDEPTNSSDDKPTPPGGGK